jgi:hypothetical protein
MDRARATAKTGRRKLLVAALWRLPALALCIYIVMPLGLSGAASFRDFHLAPSARVGAYRLIIHQDNA